MILINEITDEPKQRHLVVIEGYDRIEMILEYKPNQYGWFATFNWQDFSINNIRLSISENVLRPYKNLIPFGNVKIMHVIIRILKIKGIL